MPGTTAIEWTATKNADGSYTEGASWNPVSGCAHVSDGCTNCYAEALSTRYRWTTRPWTKVNAPLNVTLHETRLHAPYAWKQPRRIFVNSMSDLFVKEVPDAFIRKVFAVMNDLQRHTFLILTKRPERAATWEGPWTPNIQMGTSVEDLFALKRLQELRPCHAQTLFISFEPLLEDLGWPDLTGYAWAIVGAESGRGARPMQDDWVRHLRDACLEQDVAFFFKQRATITYGPNGPFGKKEPRPLLDGVRWEQYPPTPQPVTLFEEGAGGA